MSTTRLPSGLLVVDTSPPPRPEPVVERPRCQTCGAVPPDEVGEPFIGHGLHTPAGFWCHHWWMCGHTKSWECPACMAVPHAEAVFQSCPVCGCGGEYT